jgi:hypothetical protein
MIYTPEGTYLNTLSGNINSYSHTLSAMGGFWDASIEFSANMDTIDEWLATGIGRHIAVYDEAQVLIWEGFVNEISASMGPFSVTRGSLMDVVNQSSVVYSELDINAASSTGNGSASTTSVTNATSALKYGIIEQTFSAGTVTATEALAIQALILAELSEPETTKELNTSSSSSPSVTLSCLGYVHWMKYIYNQTAATGGWNISDKIADILDADPNGIFSSANANILENTYQVAKYEDQDREAWSLLKTLASQGNVANERYTIGVYGGRKVRYARVPTSITYQQLLADPAQNMLTLAGQLVRPWNVMPARWLIFPDFLSGRVPPSTLLRSDPRIMFIES